MRALSSYLPVLALALFFAPGFLRAQKSSVESATSKDQTTIPSAETKADKQVRMKLDSIIIDKCNFSQFDLTKILPYLTKRSKELDPEHEGVRFILVGLYKPPGGPIHREVSYPSPSEQKSVHREIAMTIENVPLGEVIGYCCQQTDHKYRIENGAVIVFPVETEADKRVREKLASIIIDKCDSEQPDLAVMLPFLTQRSKDLDPEHVGVKLILMGAYKRPSQRIDSSGRPIHREVVQTFEDMPLGELLRYLVSANDYQFKIENGAVVVFPKSKDASP